MVARGWCKVQETLLIYFIIFEMEIHEHIQVLRGGTHSSVERRSSKKFKL